jgi:hypothetical protein
MDGLTVKILKQIIIYGWPNSKNIDGNFRSQKAKNGTISCLM